MYTESRGCPVPSPCTSTGPGRNPTWRVPAPSTRRHRFQLAVTGGDRLPVLDGHRLRTRWNKSGVPAQPAISGVSPSTGVPVASQAVVSFGTVAGATSYRVTSSPVDGHADGWAVERETVTGAASPLTVTSLQNGVRYSFTVAAINATVRSSRCPFRRCPPQPPPTGQTCGPGHVPRCHGHRRRVSERQPGSAGRPRRVPRAGGAAGPHHIGGRAGSHGHVPGADSHRGNRHNSHTGRARSRRGVPGPDGAAGPDNRTSSAHRTGRVPGGHRRGGRRDNRHRNRARYCRRVPGAGGGTRPHHRTSSADRIGRVPAADSHRRRNRQRRRRRPDHCGRVPPSDRPAGPGSRTCRARRPGHHRGGYRPAGPDGVVAVVYATTAAYPPPAAGGGAGPPLRFSRPLPRSPPRDANRADGAT